MVAELPYWSHPDADDQTPTDESYADLLRRCADALGSSGVELQAILDEASPMLTINSPFLEPRVPSSRCSPARLRPTGPGPTGARRPDGHGRRAVRCEDLVRCFRLRYGGMLLRALEAETVAGTAPAPLRRLRDRLAERYATWQADEATGPNRSRSASWWGCSSARSSPRASHVSGPPTRASRPPLATSLTGGA